MLSAVLFVKRGWGSLGVGDSLVVQHQESWTWWVYTIDSMQWLEGAQ